MSETITLEGFIDEMRNRLLVAITIATFSMVLLVRLLIQSGIYVSPDSVYYIASAESLQNGLGFTVPILSWDAVAKQEPVTLWPPFYPILLAFTAQIFNDSIEFAARVINVVGFWQLSFLTCLTILFIIEGLEGIIAAVIAAIMLLTNISVLKVYLSLRSEGLFILLVYVGVLIMVRIWQNEASRKRWIWVVTLACVTVLTFYTRYTGIVLVGTAFLFLLISPAAGFRDVVLFTLGSGIPILFWLFRNMLLSGFPTGLRSESTTTLEQSVNQILSTTTRWFIPSLDYWNITRGILVTIVIAMAVMVVVLVRLRFSNKASNDSWKKLISPLLWALSLWVILYMTFVLVAKSRISFDALDDRILAPIAQPLIVWMFALFSFVIHYLKHNAYFSNILKHKHIVEFTVYGMLLLWLILLPLQSFWKINLDSNIDHQFAISEKYQTQYWKDMIKGLGSDTFDDQGLAIFSNAPDLLYYHLGIRPIAWIPPKDVNCSKFLTKILSNDRAVIVWIDQITWRDYLYSEDQLKECGWAAQEHFSGGTIYVPAKWLKAE